VSDKPLHQRSPIQNYGARPACSFRKERMEIGTWPYENRVYGVLLLGGEFGLGERK
jgi:hypothetical protein